MNTKRKVAPRPLDDRVTVHHLTVNGRHVQPGQPLTVEGIRGRVAFRTHTTHVNGAEWVDVVDKHGYVRAVRPDSIRTVHRQRAA